MSDKDYKGDDFVIKVSEKELKRALVSKYLGRLCNCKKRTAILDYTNRRLECSECGAPIDPFDFLEEIASNEHMHWQNLKAMRDEKEELEKWMLNNRMGHTLRDMASKKRSGHIPLCPHCNKPFEFEQIKSWTSKEYAIYLMQKEKFKI